MQVFVNEEPHRLAPGTTVAQLVDTLGLESRYLAVERNRELVPRGEHATCRLAEGDRIEIVTLVGGG